MSLGAPASLVDAKGTTNAVQVTANSAARIEGASGGTAVGVAGDVADDAVDSGNPVKIGGVARTANPTSVAGGDRVNASFDDLGRIVVVPHQVRDLVVHQQTAITNSTTETTILAAGAAGVFHDILAIILANTDATDSAVVTIKDATAGTTRLIVPVPAYGTVIIQLPIPLTQASAANTWTATVDVNTVGSLQVTVLAVKNI